MSAREAGSVRKFRLGSTRSLPVCAVAALLALAGCSPESTTPIASPSVGSPSAAPPSPSAAPGGTDTSGFPEVVFTDAELAAILNSVAQNRNLPAPVAQSSERQRSGAASGAFPPVSTETTPGECIAFVPENPFVRWADKNVNFAEGAMPLSEQSGPTTTVMITLRSAEKDAIATADFSYPDDLAPRCGQFDLTATESGQTSTYAVQLLAAPPIGEKQHGYLQNPKPKGPGDYGAVGLRVLAGTMSVSLTLAVAELNSESDAKPALDSLAGLAKELIDQAVKSPPTVAPPPANSRTPDDVVALLNGVTGPDGSPVSLPAASVIGPPPGTTAAPSSQPVLPCTFSDMAYYGPLTGAVLGQGMTGDSSKMESTEFTVVSMPTTSAPPYPFDTRAAALRDCPAVVEEDFGGSQRQWSSVSALNMALPSDSSYAVVYQLSDGTGEWHVRAGARRGSLSVEANGKTPSPAEAQATADRFAGFFGRVFANAGL